MESGEVRLSSVVLCWVWLLKPNTSGLKSAQNQFKPNKDKKRWGNCHFYCVQCRLNNIKAPYTNASNRLAKFHHHLLAVPAGNKDLWELGERSGLHWQAECRTGWSTYLVTSKLLRQKEAHLEMLRRPLRRRPGYVNRRRGQYLRAT